jgi:hypothetical protein
MAALRSIFATFGEGLAAHREYEALRSRGMPHDTALRAALGLGARPSGHKQSAAKPLYCAGRA